jgi:hypothetical protein
MPEQRIHVIDVEFEYAELWLLRQYEEVRVADETGEVSGLNRPVSVVQLTGGKIVEHSCEVIVDLVEQIVYAGSVAGPVVVTVREDCVNSW